MIAAAAQLPLHPHAPVRTPRSGGPVKAGTPRLLRGINDRAALDLLLEHGPLSRSQLGDLTGLSKPTTSQLLGRLEEDGLVIASGNTARRPRPARPAVRRQPRRRPRGRPRRHPGPDPRRRRRPHRPHRGRVRAAHAPPAAARTPWPTCCRRWTGPPPRPALPRSDLRHLAIGTPGAFDPRTRRLRYARHLPGWHDPDLLERLADAVGHPDRRSTTTSTSPPSPSSPPGRGRGVDDFVLLWADEGLGAAIVIDGRLRGGATGGAGEVGFLPLPGTPLVRDVRRGNAGAFQELAGGPRCWRSPAPSGIRASTPPAAVAAALDRPGAGDRLLAELAHRLAARALGDGRRRRPRARRSSRVGRADRRRPAPPDLVADELGRCPRPGHGWSWPAVQDRPVLAGALHTALTSARDEVFDTVRQPTTDPGHARPVTRRSP